MNKLLVCIKLRGTNEVTSVTLDVDENYNPANDDTDKWKHGYKYLRSCIQDYVIHTTGLTYDEKSKYTMDNMQVLAISNLGATSNTSITGFNAASKMAGD